MNIHIQNSWSEYPLMICWGDYLALQQDQLLGYLKMTCYILQTFLQMGLSFISACLVTRFILSKEKLRTKLQERSECDTGRTYVATYLKQVCHTSIYLSMYVLHVCLIYIEYVQVFFISERQREKSHIFFSQMFTY